MARPMAANSARYGGRYCCVDSDQSAGISRNIVRDIRNKVPFRALAGLKDEFPDLDRGCARKGLLIVLKLRVDGDNLKAKTFHLNHKN